MSKNLKRILRVLGFFLAVILMLQLTSLFLKQRYDRLDIGKMNYHFSGIYGEAPHTIDVLLIGDSECYSGFSPMEMWERQGLTAYGAGTLAQTPQETYEYLRDILKHQSPSVVVLETEEFFSMFTEVTLDRWLRSQMRMAFPGLDNHDSWRAWGSAVSEPAPRYVDDSKGYYHVYEAKTPSDHQLEQYMKPSEETETMDGRRLRIFRRIVKLCEDRDIQLVLVSTPSTKNWNMPRHNTMTELSEACGIPYLDLNLLTENLGLDWERHTQDGGDHLNHGGARIVSRKDQIINKEPMYRDISQ